MMHTVLTVVALAVAGVIFAVPAASLATPALIRRADAREAAKRARQSAPSPIDTKETTNG